MPKYMALLCNYEAKIEEFGIDEEYSKILKELIYDTKHYPRHSDCWKTHTRKRMLALLLYVHWHDKGKREELDTFF
jgi:hypothetical protein